MNDLERFFCKLAIELGQPLAVIKKLPASEIRLWQEYFSENLFTSDAIQYQLAQLAYIQYNQYASDKLGIESFLPKVKKQEEYNPYEVIDRLELLRGVLGG